ncbi:MAG: hypothetical protein DME60_03215 [Verrucomicrobia bacterium]|nr:MAG: hypothetical protein DME60_03215 [Verrucomicrobiota bacterium]
MGFSFFRDFISEAADCKSDRLSNKVTKLLPSPACEEAGRIKLFLVKRKKTFMRFADSNPTLGMDNSTSNSEALFSRPQCLAQRSITLRTSLNT